MNVDVESNFDDALLGERHEIASMMEEALSSSLSFSLSPSPHKAQQRPFIEDTPLESRDEIGDLNAVPDEILQLEEFIKSLEDSLSIFEPIQTISDLRNESNDNASSPPSSSSRHALAKNRVTSSGEEESERSIANTFISMSADDEVDAEIAAEEEREDQRRLEHYHKCLNSSSGPAEAIISPYVTPHTVRSRVIDPLDEELLQTPQRVEAMLAVVSKCEKEKPPRSANHERFGVGENSIVCGISLPSRERRAPKPSLRITSFFHSALDAEDSSPDKPSTPSQEHSGSDSLADEEDDALFAHRALRGAQQRAAGPRGREEFTVASLRRNWEMEDEMSDDDGDDEDFVLPDRSSPVALPVCETEDNGVTVSMRSNTSPVVTNDIGSNVLTPLSSQSPSGRFSPSPSPVQPLSVFSSGKDEPSQPPSLSIEVPAPASRSAKQRSGGGANEQDLRLHGDFSVWSNGKMLNPLFLHREYVGLSPSSATHVLSARKVVPISVALQDVLRAGQAADTKASLSYAEHMNDVLSLYSSTTSNSTSGGGNRSFYVLHVVECVIRPDVELQAVMAVVVKLAKHFKCKCVLQKRNHAVLVRGRSSATGASLLGADDDTSEWDQLDMQVCMSRELRQRVVLMQFLRKTSMFGSGGLALLAGQLTGPTDYIPLRKCPATKKLVSLFKKELINQELTLSCLYNLSLDKVCTLSKGLDKHFLAQLHNLCRESMLQRLSADYKSMEDHFQQQEQEAKVFLETIEPILKQYGCDVPETWTKKRLNKRTLANRAKQEELIAEKMSSDAVINRLQDISILRAQMSEGSREEDLSRDILLTSTLNSSVLDFPELPKTPDRPPRSSPSRYSYNGNNNDDDGNVGEKALFVISVPSPTSSPAMRKYRSELERETEHLDGITLCLMLLDKCYQSMQESCDLEYEERVKQRNSTTILLVGDILAYKREALQSILDFPGIHQTSTMKSFQQSFQGVHALCEKDLLEEKRREAAQAQAQAQAESSSAKMSWFQKIQTGLSLMSDSNSTASADGNMNKSKSRSESQSTTIRDGSLSPVKRELPFRLNRAVVLYYCSGLIGNVPGTLYVTQSHVCFSSSVLGFNAKREVFCLEHLTDISLPSATTTNAADKSNNTSGVNLFKPNTLKLVFYFGLREVFVTPLAVDSLRVKAMIELIKQQFAV